MPPTSSLGILAAITLLSACVGDVGSSRKPTLDDPGGACTKLERDVVIRTTADMTMLPNTGCDLTIRQFVRRLHINDIRQKLLALESLFEFALRFTGT